MAQKTSSKIDEGTLTKGQLRKLNALRKSVGDDIGGRAFAEWITSQSSDDAAEKTDKNAELIKDTLWPLVERGSIRIPRGGYVVKRGRGRIVVEPVK